MRNLLLTLVLSAGLPQALVTQDFAPRAGTFAVRVCVGGCDRDAPDATRLTGHVVIDSEPLPWHQLSVSDLTIIERTDTSALSVRTACYAFRDSVGVPTIAGSGQWRSWHGQNLWLQSTLEADARTSSHQRIDWVEFDDSSFVAFWSSARFERSDPDGTRHSHSGPFEVRGLLIGPPDVTKCAEHIDVQGGEEPQSNKHMDHDERVRL